jgi:hypothetical protein
MMHTGRLNFYGPIHFIEFLDLLMISIQISSKPFEKAKGLQELSSKYTMDPVRGENYPVT